MATNFQGSRGRDALAGERRWSPGGWRLGTDVLFWDDATVAAAGLAWANHSPYPPPRYPPATPRPACNTSSRAGRGPGTEAGADAEGGGSGGGGGARGAGGCRGEAIHRSVGLYATVGPVMVMAIAIATAIAIAIATAIATAIAIAIVTLDPSIHPSTHSSIPSIPSISFIPPISFIPYPLCRRR